MRKRIPVKKPVLAYSAKATTPMINMTENRVIEWKVGEVITFKATGTWKEGTSFGMDFSSEPPITAKTIFP